MERAKQKEVQPKVKKIGEEQLDYIVDKLDVFSGLGSAENHQRGTAYE